MPLKRPADFNQRAKMVVDLATGQIEEDDEPKGRQRSGLATAAGMTPEQRYQRAKKAAAARWRKRAVADVGG